MAGASFMSGANGTMEGDAAALAEKELPQKMGASSIEDNTTTPDDGARDQPQLTQKENDKIAALAESLKTSGNDMFSKSHYHEAVEIYGKAIEEFEKLPSSKVHTVYCNRALCQIKLENYGAAVMDAEKSIASCPTFGKGYYRRGCAYLCLFMYKNALKDFQAVCRISNDADAAMRLKECQKMVKQQRFAAAISSERSVPISESLDLESIPIESSYSGPVYNGNKSDTLLGEVIEYLGASAGNKLAPRVAYAVVMDIVKLLKQSSTLVRICIPDKEEFTVCGDVHGQFYDLMNIFKINGLPSPKNPYLFNGDFVDRGSFSVECIITLFVAKLMYPDSVHLARGNHETCYLNKIYGFAGEVTAKYDARLYQLFCEAFCYLPLAHVLNNAVLVVHGGLFKQDGVTLDDIANTDRVREPPDEGIMTELLWADPQPKPGRAPSKRGVGLSFGPDVTKRFLNENGLKMLVRSHEMKEEGYEVECDGRLVTVFSAPNYCDQMGNKGALMRFKGNDMVNPKYTKFEAVPHPHCPPMTYASPMLSFLG